MPELEAREAALEGALLDVATESWRLVRMISRLIAKLDAGEGNRYASQVRYFQKKLADNLDANGFSFVDVEGQIFDPGMAAAALNIADFGPEDALVVDQVIEPIIVGPEGLKRTGTVMLRRSET